MNNDYAQQQQQLPSTKQNYVIHYTMEWPNFNGYMDTHLDNTKPVRARC